MDKTPPEGYTEDEMGLLVDPDSTGSNGWQPPVATPEPLPLVSEGMADAVPNEEPPLRRIPLAAKVALVALAVCVVIAGIGGLLMYRSVSKVRALASDIQGQASTLKDAFLSGDEMVLRSTASSVSAGVDQIRAETDSSLWSFAESLPMVGGDITSAKALVACADDLCDNALAPLVDGVAGVRLGSVVQEGRIDTDIIRRMRDSVVAASPVIVADAQAISELPRGSISQVNDIIDKLRDPLAEASSFLADADGLFNVVLSMLGDGGQTRNYVLVAQTNSEIRSGGGFPGSVGWLHVTDGYLTLEDFQTVYGVKGIIEGNDMHAAATEEEINAFNPPIADDAAGITLTPNFVRSGELARDFWSQAYGVQVDGVFGLDPIFLQRMLALTGPVICEDGTEVNGDNAAYEVLSNVYWRYGTNDPYNSGNDEEDAFFVDVANRAADSLLNNLGNVDFEQFLDTLTRSGEDRRLQVWMANPDEEALMERLGVSGALEDDVTKPVLGLYANDNTWSKISWYLDIRADVDEGVRNEDGTITHRVAAHFVNNLTAEEAAVAPLYVCGTNPMKVDRGDMLDTLFIVAPAGATITDFQVQGIFAITEYDPTAEVPIYGHDTWRTWVRIPTQSEAVCTFALTLPAEATEPLTIRTSPLCHD